MKTRFLIIIGTISVAIGFFLVLSQIDFYDYNKYYEVFGQGSPLAEYGSGNPVLDENNCERYTHWLTEHQKEKLTLREDFAARYPPWGNQIFPLVDYCLENGDLRKFQNGDKIMWSFYRISED